jgi:AcrR family transcriptional regulator
MRASYHHGNLKTALLRSVEDIISTEGVDAVTSRSVAEATGVSHTASRHHYGSKAGLLTAFVIEGFRDLEQSLANAYGTMPDAHPLERFRAVGDAYLRFAEQRSAHFQVMFQPSLFDAEDENYVTASTATYAVLANAADDVAEAGIVPTEAAGALAVLAWGTVHGLAVLWHQGSLDTQVVSYTSLAEAGNATLPLLGGLLAGPNI